MRMDSHAEIARLRLRISELERQREEVAGFAAVAAHELLTPVVMIDACAATVADRLDDQDERHDETRRDLDVLRRGCVQSRLLIESLLHQAACANRPLRPRRVALQRVVEDASRCCRPRSALEASPSTSASSRSSGPRRRCSARCSTTCW